MDYLGVGIDCFLHLAYEAIIKYSDTSKSTYGYLKEQLQPI